MVSRGARYLVILSRPGSSTNTAQALVCELEAQEVVVAMPAIDISNLSRLRATLTGLKNTIPPIRGCIQATVALRDNFWSNMSFDDWNISMDSKITSSCNLHPALPGNLDFFVFISSNNGIFGDRSQANYAAGNTFKDALTHHRLSLV